MHGYLTEVPGNLHIMPGIVIKFSIDRLNQGLKGPWAQVDNQRDGTVLQRQVDVVSRFACVEHQAVALQSLEGKRDLIAAALDGVRRQIITEVLWALEGRHILLSHWKIQGLGKKGKNVVLYWMQNLKLHKTVKQI